MSELIININIYSHFFEKKYYYILSDHYNIKKMNFASDLYYKSDISFSQIN